MINGDAARMSGGMRREIFARSLLLQSFWSFERMQSLGLAFSLEPWLKACYPREQERRDALIRHQGFFNTQPYMATMILGMVCALEEEAAGAAAGERDAKVQRLLALKTAASGALAGIGDALFWGTLRPLCAALALAAGLLLLKAGAPRSVLWVPAIYLTAYNVPVLLLRWKGLELGYEWKEQIAVRLKQFPWQSWIRRLRLLGFALALALLAMMLEAAASPAQRMAGALSAGAYLVALRVLPAWVSAGRLYAATCVVGILAGAAGWL